MPSVSFGLLVPLTGFPYGATELDQVETVVGAGLVDGIWVRDLPAVPTGDPDVGQGGDPFAYLAFLAGRRVTPSVVGTASVILGVRHPWVVARAAVGLQQQTRSRVVLGVGTGGKPAMNRALGVHDRSRAAFASDWRALRQVLRDPPADGVTFLVPPGYRPPPMHLATTDLAKWEAIDGDADGWQTFATDPDDFVRDHRRVCEIRGGSTDVSVRVDAIVLPSVQSPRAVMSGRGRVTGSLDQVLDLLQVWRDLPVRHVLLGLRARQPLDALRVIRDAWPHVPHTPEAGRGSQERQKAQADVAGLAVSR